LSAGVDVKTVQAWLGHAGAELTLNLYGHHMGTDSERAGIARIKQVLGKTGRGRVSKLTARSWLVHFAAPHLDSET
jgi:hypothetical protein